MLAIAAAALPNRRNSRLLFSNTSRIQEQSGHLPVWQGECHTDDRWVARVNLIKCKKQRHVNSGVVTYQMGDKGKMGDARNRRQQGVSSVSPMSPIFSYIEEQKRERGVNRGCVHAEGYGRGAMGAMGVMGDMLKSAS